MKIYVSKNCKNMSLHPNWVALATVEIPRWKNFVKSSENETPSKSGNTYSTRLNFKGIEAKKTYDDIVGQNLKTDLSSEEKIVKTTTATVEPLNKFQSNNLGLKKVSINSILKAVEQNDLCFLIKYLNSDNVDLSDDFGWTPLMSAAYNGNIKVVEYLLKLGVNKRAKEKSGLTAAQLALKRNHLSIVALLKRKNSIGNNDSKVTDNGINLLRNKSDDELFSNGDATQINLNKDTNVEFYCKICKSSFKKCSVKQHESSTLHIFNTKPKLRSVAYGIAKQNKGYQMLLNTGWEEENGLGPFGDGAKYPVKTILKRDRKGFGLTDDKEARVTHFKAGDISAVNTNRIVRQKTLKKKDREKLLTREAMKDRMIRIALS